MSFLRPWLRMRSCTRSRTTRTIIAGVVKCPKMFAKWNGAGVMGCFPRAFCLILELQVVNWCLRTSRAKRMLVAAALTS